MQQSDKVTIIAVKHLPYKQYTFKSNTTADIWNSGDWTDDYFS